MDGSKWIRRMLIRKPEIGRADEVTKGASRAFCWAFSLRWICAPVLVIGVVSPSWAGQVVAPQTAALSWHLLLTCRDSQRPFVLGRTSRPR